MTSSRFLAAFTSLTVASALSMSLATAKPGRDIRLERLVTFDGEGAEIAVFDDVNQLVLVTNGVQNRIDVFPLFGGGTMTSFDMEPYGAGVQSVAVKNGLAVAVSAADPVTLPGKAVFFDPSAPAAGASAVVPVGALPDMVTFDHQGRRVLVANEGEPRCIDGGGNPVTDPSLATNPEGSVSIIPITRGQPGAAVTVGFGAFDGSESVLRAKGVRVGTWPGATVAQDLEPEYITLSKDGKTAFVTLQENNALAVIDVRTASVVDIVALGLKNHALNKNALDASDKDDAANIRTWPVHGMYMPDAIASWKSKGKTLVATANEGDGREYFANKDNADDGSDLCFLDEARVKDLTLTADFPLPLDIANLSELQEDENLGRLKVTRFFPSVFEGGTPPTNDTDPKEVEDLEYSKLASYGARSVSIWNADGNLIWDSGDQIAQEIRDTIGDDAWVDGDVIGTTAAPDSRSDDKGAEPEAVVAGRAYGRDLLFVGLERAGGIVVFDATNPAAPVLLEWKQTEDISPEGMQFIREEDSPIGAPLLVVSYEISGTTTVFKVLK